LGARITQHILEKAVDNGLFDDAALFHGHYEPVGGDTTRYHTQYDGFFDRNVVTILKAFQANDDIYYAYVVNNDGYFPAHTDSEKSKTMHADAGPPAAAPPGESYDRLVKSQAGHTFRESRSPILVHGRSWGEFCVGIPEALANVRGRETAVSTFCATMLLSLIVVGAMACLIRRGLRPLRELTCATRQMSAGNVASRCSYAGRDEIGELAHSFNAMADTISRTQEGLERQVQDRTAQLRESEDSYRRLFVDNGAIMFQIDPRTGVIVAANAAAVEFYGYPAERLVGMAIEAINTMPRDGILAALATVRHGGGNRFEFQHRVADGSLRDVEVYGTFIQCGRREVCHSIIHDITDRKRIEAARLQAEQLRRSLLDNSAVGIFLGSPDRCIREASARACAMFGYTPDEMLGRSFRLIHLSEEHFQDFGRQYQSLTGPGITSIDFPFRRKDGSVIWCSAFGTRLDDNGAEKGYIWTLLDIPALREAQALARRLSRAVEQTPASVVMTDLQGNITFVNRGFCQATGYEEQEALGKNPRVLKSGEMPASVYREMWEKLTSGQQWRGELQNRRKNGEIFWESAVIAPVMDEEGNATHYVAVKEDITQRKRAEESLRLAKDAAEAANRAKSEFLANMSHEIRTPMTAILGYTDILAESATRSEQQEAIQTIKRNGKHLLDVINDILDLSKIEADKLQVECLPTSPLAILADVTSLMRVRAEAKGLPLNLEYVGPIPQTIQTDPTRLRQILVNLVGNAIKFTETGEVKIRVRLVDRDTAEPKLQCEVIDSGVGISPQHLALLFRPFQQADASTNRKFGGTGLGLAISKRLAAILHGDIVASSTPGAGSVFSLTIATGPLDGITLLDQPAEAMSRAVELRPAATVTQLSCRILLAEDGPDNQRLIAFVLRKAGAEVHICENGKKAMEKGLATVPGWGRRFDDPKMPFDVILMDMQMPVMDGYEATRQLRQHGYTGPILALTAHAMKDDMQKCLDAGCDDYLTKPIEPQKFLATIARWAAGDRGSEAPLQQAVGDGGANPVTAGDLLYSDLAADPDLSELVEMFVGEMANRITTLETQARDRDWQQLNRTAHQLKGAAGSYGFGAITPFALRLENLTKTDCQEEAILAALDDLLKLCRQVRAGKSPKAHV